MVMYPHSTISKSSLVDRDRSRSPKSNFKMKLHLKVFSRLHEYKFELRIQKHTKHKKCLAHALETSKTADMEKNVISITQICGEVKVVGEDRLQSNFKGHFSTLACCLLTILSHNILSLVFIFMVKILPT